MNFYQMLKLLETDQIDPTKRINLPRTNFSDEKPMDFSKPSSTGRQILPIRDYLMNIKIGQSAAVMLNDFSATDKLFANGWKVEGKGERFVRLRKEPTDDSVGGMLVVPNQVYMNWQLAQDQGFINSRT